ncbi:MAG: hypothetical protein KAF40_08260, partial [Flavihumibacter sp.]|nr:hypothetical protein [Flavihumibacter sp.]
MRKLLLALLSTFLVLTSWSQRSTVVFSGSVTNDLYTMLQKQGFQLLHQPDPETAIQAASKGGSVFIVSDQYPAQRVQLSDVAQQLAKKKKLKVYIEYPEALSGLTITGDTLHTQLERGVITSTVFGATLKPLSILGINDCYILPTKASNPLIILGKVAGLNRAEYGI